MKIVLSNKLYLKPTEEVKERMELGLKYRVFDPHAKQQIPRLILHYGPVANGVYWMPVERIDLLEGVEYEVVDKRCYKEAEFPEPTFQLRDDQQAIYDEADGSCIVNAKPGK